MGILVNKETAIQRTKAALLILVVVLLLFFSYRSWYFENQLVYEEFERGIDNYCFLKLDGVSWEWRGCSPECKLKDGTTKLMPHHRK